MTSIINLDSMATVCDHGNLWDSPENQLRRAIGRFATVYVGGVAGGTVRDEQGKCWDWWPTDVVLPSGFAKIEIVEAK